MPEILRPNKSNIERAARALMNGSLIGLPTETVYGLAADAENEKSVSLIYDMKQRPRNLPLIIHIGSRKLINKWAIEIPDYVRELAEKFWPGPLTIILKKSELAKNFVTSNQNSVALRVPRHNTALMLLNKFHELGGNGLAAPSANRFTGVSPTTAEDVKKELSSSPLNELKFILDGGQCEIGIESTIVDCRSDKLRILRPGAIGISDLMKFNLSKDETVDNNILHFPGNSKKHYSPRAQIILEGNTSPGDGFIAMSEVPTPVGAIRLLCATTVEEYGKYLYSSFRKADLNGIERVIVVPPMGTGLADAIRNRISKSRGE